MEHFQHIPRTHVHSTNLRDVGYDPSTQTLTIHFKDGGAYAYLGVPPALHSELLNAPSKGRFFREAIRPRFRTVKFSA